MSQLRKTQGIQIISEISEEGCPECGLELEKPSQIQVILGCYGGVNVGFAKCTKNRGELVALGGSL